MTHTAAPATCSSSSKIRPLASFQLPVSNQSLVLPLTLVAQLRPLATTVTLARPSGATAATPPISAWIALPWIYAQLVVAKTGYLRLDRLRRAIAKRDHGDHRSDADDNSKDGEKRAQHIASD